MIYALTKWIHYFANRCNWLSALAIFLMMILCCTDIICRWAGHSLPGIYELIGLLGTLAVSLSLGYTAIEKSHIAVNYILDFFPASFQRIVEGLNYIICAFLFALASWQSAIYANDMKQFGEVSLTLQMPLYPFIYGISIGCGVLFAVLIIRVARIFSTPYSTENQ
jgi:TRAP-type C4-dicarboxylate transport system permease small subunit